MTVHVVALARRVLAVAVTHEEPPQWAAYIDAVPGDNHESEQEGVALRGRKLTETVARAIFKDIPGDLQYRV